MRVISGMTITAKKDEVLRILKKNREDHIEIVKEARTGYVEAAKKALLSKLDKIQSGEIVELEFSLCPPRDHTKVYTTTITMLEMDVSDEVKLTSEQVRHLIMDEWESTKALRTGLA